MSQATTIGHWYDRNRIAKPHSAQRVATRRQALRSAGTNYSIYRNGRPAYVKRRSKASQQVLENVMFVVMIAIIIFGAGIAGGPTGY